VIEDGARPNVAMDLRYESAEVHRGVLQADGGVFIPSTTISLPTKEDGTIVVNTEGSIELSDDNGSAWRPDGHSGRFSRLDWSALYEQRLEDALLTFGLISYNLPNGSEFAFGERGATTEFLVEAMTEVGGVSPSLSANYDFDEAKGLYLQAAVGKDVELREGLQLGLEVSLGWMDEDQAFWQMAQEPPASGLADLRLTAELAYALDAHTSALLEVGYSEMVDDDFKTWMNFIGIDPRQGWVGAAVRWSY
jgi:hypothetical protein